MRMDLPLAPMDEPEPCAARVPLFTGLDLEQLRRVSALARPLVLEAGDALHLAGADADEATPTGLTPALLLLGALALLLVKAETRDQAIA